MAKPAGGGRANEFMALKARGRVTFGEGDILLRQAEQALIPVMNSAGSALIARSTASQHLQLLDLGEQKPICLTSTFGVLSNHAVSSKVSHISIRMVEANLVLIIMQNLQTRVSSLNSERGLHMKAGFACPVPC